MKRNILVISHNALRLNSSNGRTLAKLLNGCNKENLAQLFITNEAPDKELASTFYRVTDIEVLKSFFNRKFVVDGKISDEVNKNHEDIHRKVKSTNGRTPFKYFARNFLWNRRRWWNKTLDSWIADFNPKMLLVQVSDCAFIMKLALDISNHYNIPIVIYNSEDYFFKKNHKYNVIQIYNRVYYKKVFKKLLNEASFNFFSCEKLLKTYLEEFPSLKGDVIYTASDLSKTNKIQDIYKYQLTYAGNLGLNRHKSLIKLAKKIQASNKKFDIDVFGNAPNENIRKELEDCKGINYHGFVEYSLLTSYLGDSKMILHVEDFSEFTSSDIKHGFTTKVSDALSLGKPFVVYAPRCLAISEFVIDHNCGFWLPEDFEVEVFLEDIKSKSFEICSNALRVSNSLFNQEKNNQIVLEIIERYI